MWVLTAQAGIDEGMAAFRAGRFEAALKEFEPLAAGGDALAQLHLGMMYEQGSGVPRDSALAVSWFRRAAERGNAAAQRNLGVMYATGRGRAAGLCPGAGVVSQSG
ncbi:tetratricopeptide repeat protein [Methylogaea oryzae]|uniref:tetratricopeptide repeat protein n=1 Tax=Methylogaea oryzae TaxID=1295382 RepID=UPI0026E58A29|nr:tetratricopeptide repeat protein [Methylogaea oryzae]